MDIKTKFNFGQRIQHINRGNQQVNIVCPLCHGKKEVQVVSSDEYVTCPKCYGDGYKTEYKPTMWYVPEDSYSNFVIQHIGINLHNPNNKKWNEKRNWIYYMNDSSGTMYDEKDCFASIEEAQAECDRRNREENLTQE